MVDKPMLRVLLVFLLRIRFPLELLQLEQDGRLDGHDLRLAQYFAQWSPFRVHQPRLWQDLSQRVLRFFHYRLCLYCHKYRTWKNSEEYSTATRRSEEHTSELQSLMRISYAVLRLKKKKH